MKIALCFCGQARSFLKGYEYYKRNLLDKFDVDVFIHTWNGEGVSDIVDLYKPVKHIIQDTQRWNPDPDKKYTNTPDAQKYPPRFTVSMFYSMFKVRELLLESEKKYDWVIRSRTDYALNLQIPFGDSRLDNSKLYIPACRMVPTRDFGNDQFAFSSQENMLKYMSTYQNIDKYYQNGNQMIGEDMMRANLHEHNLFGDNLIYVDMNNPFPPGLHNGTWHSLIRDDYELWTKNN